MMNKILTKKSLLVASIVTAFVILVSIVLNCVIGVNYAATAGDSQTLTVTVDDYYFDNELDKVEEVCEKVFDDKDVNYDYCYKGVMSGDSELVYVFDEDAALADVKTALEAAVQSATADGGSLDGSFIYVTSGSESIGAAIPLSYLLKACGGILLFAALAFLYTAVRYRLHMGVLTAISTLVGALLSATLILLVRIPVTTSAFAIVAVSALLATVFTLLTLNKVRANLKSEEYKEKSAEELVGASVATKEILLFAITLGVALVLVGAIATTAVRWFALASLVGLLAATFVGLCFAPALYAALYKHAAARSAAKPASGYVGAKKADKKETTETEEKE